MTHSKIALLLVLALAVTGCSVSHKTGGTAAAKQSDGLFGLSTADDVKTTGEAAFKGKNKVVIGGFMVGFIENKKESQKAGGGIGGRSSAKLALLGVNDANRQRITNAAYADFVARLQSAGYTVADRSTLTGSEQFKGVNSEKSPYKQESSLFGSSSDVTYMAPSSIDAIYWTGENNSFGGIGFSTPMGSAVTYAEKSGTPVLFVSYIVDFANAEGSGGRFSAVSTLEVGQGISVVPGGAVKLFGGQSDTFTTNSGNVALGQPVYSEETFGEVIKTSTDAGVALETAVNVFTSVLGAGSNQSRSFDIKANPAKYESISTKLLKETNGKLIGKMQSLR